MERVKVKSSAVSEVGYDNGVLEVLWQNGHVTRYLAVSEREYQTVLTPGGSVGQAVNAIKATHRAE